MTQLTNLVQFPGLGLSFHLNRVKWQSLGCPKNMDSDDV